MVWMCNSYVGRYRSALDSAWAVRFSRRAWFFRIHSCFGFRDSFNVAAACTFNLPVCRAEVRITFVLDC